jgi:hypothetical protein
MKTDYSQIGWKLYIDMGRNDRHGPQRLSICPQIQQELLASGHAWG